MMIGRADTSPLNLIFLSFRIVFIVALSLNTGSVQHSYIYITFILYNIGRFYPPLINYNRSTCNYRSPSHFTSKYIYNNFRLFVFIIIVVVAVVFDLSLSNRSLAVLSPSSTQSHHFKYGGSIKIFLLSST